MRPTPWKNPPEDLIAVGEVLTTHGNKGEVKVLPLTDNPDRWLEIKRLFLCSDGGRKELTVQEVRYFREFVILKFHEVSGMGEAEELRGAFLWIPRSERPPLPEDRFYIDEILNLEAYDEEGRFLGRVKEVLPTGANDVYVLEGGYYGEILIPALKSVILSIDVSGGRMTVRLPAGLVDGED